MNKDLFKKIITKRIDNKVKNLFESYSINEDSLDDAPLVPSTWKGPGPSGTCEEVFKNSMNDLARVTYKTIIDYYNPRAYKTSEEKMKDLLHNDIKDRLLGKDMFKTFRTDEFYNTFKHWCEYYGKKKGYNSFSDVIKDVKFMDILLTKLEHMFIKKFYTK